MGLSPQGPLDTQDSGAECRRMSRILECVQDCSAFSIREIELTWRVHGDVDGNDTSDFLAKRLCGDCTYISGMLACLSLDITYKASTSCLHHQTLHQLSGSMRTDYQAFSHPQRMNCSLKTPSHACPLWMVFSQNPEMGLSSPC